MNEANKLAQQAINLDRNGDYDAAINLYTVNLFLIHTIF